MVDSSWCPLFGDLVEVWCTSADEWCVAEVTAELAFHVTLQFDIDIYDQLRTCRKTLPKSSTKIRQLVERDPEWAPRRPWPYYGPYAPDYSSDSSLEKGTKVAIVRTIPESVRRDRIG